MKGPALYRVQERLVGALLRSPGLLAVVSTAGLTRYDFPSFLGDAFAFASKGDRDQTLRLVRQGTGEIARLYRVGGQNTQAQALSYARQINDPIGSGLVRSLAHPGGNLTGFSDNDLLALSKLPAWIKDMAPSLARVAIVGGNASDSVRTQAIVIAARSVGLTPEISVVHTAGEIEDAITDARPPTPGNDSRAGGRSDPTADSSAVIPTNPIVSHAAMHSGWPSWVKNGYGGRETGTSAVPQIADDFGAARKSAEVGHKRPKAALHANWSVLR